MGASLKGSQFQRGLRTKSSLPPGAEPDRSPPVSTFYEWKKSSSGRVGD
jgi:hypothetical protein